MEERLNYELDTISTMGFVDYFLIVWDFIKYAKDHGIPVGPGRGSAAGSLVAYSLNITDLIDPIKYNLLFERFLNPERVTMPEIDIDFCYDRRLEVIDYVTRKYGADHVVQIVTFGTMSARMVIRDVGRVLDLPYAYVDSVAKAIPMELGITIAKAMKMNPELRTMYETDDSAKKLIDMAKQIIYGEEARKALQSGTSHNFGDGFAHAFGIQYTDKENKLQYVHQTSWGMTTRMIGAIIMVHGDNSGLVLPPRIAPTQVMIVPIAQKKEGVLDKAAELKNRLAKVCRVKLDDSDKSAGWKFSEYEMKGIPVRLEIGPKHIEQNQCVLARRDTGEKIIVSLDELETKVPALLDEIHENMLKKATEHRESRTYIAKTMDEFEKTINETPGFIKAMWCGDQACEDEIKEKTAATSRCIPFEQEEISDVCVCCGKPAKHMVYWGRAY